MSDRFMIYGATGYTGKLTSRMAKEKGLNPILAGRNADKVKAVAEPLGLEWRAIDLADKAALQAGLQDVNAVLHIAGPFSATSAPMADACIATGTHYLDITGEISVFEALA
ncbi:MAG: saccharopine dehydrogenase NADP-binding domain-containing protein, partial [Alphaproteobacteria bacterium]